MTTVFVSATGTEIGKTWTAVRLTERWLAQGRSVVARKPAQSFDPADPDPTDAARLGAATGEAAETVCPPHRWYELPMAPCMAAEALGRPPFTTAQLAAEIGPEPLGALRLVEGAGGARSPLAADGDNVDLARALGVRLVVVVADAGLGTVNAVRMTGEAYAGFEVLTLLNRFDDGVDLHRRNRAWLARAGYRVAVTPDELAAAIDARLPS
jgi:dethiobiotin synthetase